MVRLRYRLSWLLLVPVLLAVLVWFYKPKPANSYEYFAEQDPLHANSYWVKPRYMQDLLLLYELRDCEYAVLAFEGEWSMYQKPLFQTIQQVSTKYHGRVPFFLYRVPDVDWSDSLTAYYEQLPTFQAGMKSVGFVGLLHRGKLIATLNTLGNSVTPEEYQQKIDDYLQWNYKL